MASEIKQKADELGKKVEELEKLMTLLGNGETTPEAVLEKAQEVLDISMSIDDALEPLLEQAVKQAKGLKRDRNIRELGF